MRILALSILLLFSQLGIAETQIRQGTVLIDKGDSILDVYKLWGKPQFTVRSERTCSALLDIQQTVCSEDRKVWRRGDLFWMVQHRGSLIIKIDWTRFEDKLTAEI